MDDRRNLDRPFLRVLKLAFTQHFVVTRKQMLGLGLSSAAAALWSLPGFRPAIVELSINGSRKSTTNITVHRVGEPIPRDLTTVLGIPVTNAGRTLVDVAGATSGDALEEAVEDALRRGLTTIAHLRWVMGSRAGKAATGLGRLRSILAEAEGQKRVTASRFESKLFSTLKKARLPLPVKQFEVCKRGRFVARPDFAYPVARLAIEADSYRFHSGRMAWEGDLDRRNRLLTAGWRVLHVTWLRLNRDPQAVVQQVREALDGTLI